MRKNLIYLLTFIILLSFPVSRVFAQITSSQIDQLVQEAMDSFHVAGVAVGIVKDGEIIHAKGYGVRSVETKEKVNEHTNFAIASNSKAFTAAALAILEEEGKIKWKDKVKVHIPEFTMYNAYVTENFNIQDLLTHRSGLGLGVGDLMFFPEGADFTMDDVLSAFQHFEPESAFRTEFAYDNLLYFVAGEVIERKSGMTWEAFIEQRIFEPLNMDNSYSALPDNKEGINLATPHSTNNGNPEPIEHYEKMINGAAGGIYSNVEDISNWMLMHLNEGKYGAEMQQKLFTEKNQREMWKIHTTLNVFYPPRYNSHFAGYGLGWFLADISGNMSVSHTGGLPGMLSKTIMIPDLDLGVVILTNTANGGGALFSAVAQTIVDSYLGLEDFNWIEKYAERLKSNQSHADSVTASVWETVEAANGNYINKEDYTGIYEDDWFGKVEIFDKDGQLWFRSFRSPKLNGPMYYYKANTFAIRWEYQDMNADAFASFFLNEEGKAQSIKMKGISPDIDFSFDFHDLELKRQE